MNIHKTYTTTIPRHDLFQAWVSSDSIVEPITKIESNPVVGGEYILYSGSPTEPVRMVGTFMKVVPDELIEYSWNWEGQDETTIVRVVFTDKDGGTEISLAHTGFESEESKKMHDEGWDSYFNGLEKLVLDTK